MKTSLNKSLILLATLSTLMAMNSSAYADRRGYPNLRRAPLQDRLNSDGLLTATGRDLEGCVSNILQDILFSSDDALFITSGKLVMPGDSDYGVPIRNIHPVRDGYTFKLALGEYVHGYGTVDYTVRGWIRLHSHHSTWAPDDSSCEGRQIETINCSVKLNRDSRTPLVNLSLRDENNQVILTLGQGMEPNTLP